MHEFDSWCIRSRTLPVLHGLGGRVDPNKVIPDEARSGGRNESGVTPYIEYGPRDLGQPNEPDDLGDRI